MIKNENSPNYIRYFRDKNPSKKNPKLKMIVPAEHKVDYKVFKKFPYTIQISEKIVRIGFFVKSEIVRWLNENAVNKQRNEYSFTHAETTVEFGFKTESKLNEFIQYLEQNFNYVQDEQQ